MAAAAVLTSAPETESMYDVHRLSYGEIARDDDVDNDDDDNYDDSDGGCVLACLLWASILVMLLLESWPALVVLASLVVVALCGGDGRRPRSQEAPPPPPHPHPDCKSSADHGRRHSSRRKDVPSSTTTYTSDKAAPHTLQPPPPPMTRAKLTTSAAAAPRPAIWSSDLYEVRPASSPGRGLGLFARRAIRRGTRVIAEAPLFAVASSSTPTDGVVAAVAAAVEQLGAADRAAYRACHAYRGAGEHEAAVGRDLLVFRSNAYTVPGEQWAMFLGLARVNHSCVPNVANAWDAARAVKVLWAVRDIAAGEEICVTYVRLLQGREERRRRLAQYGFLCECAACLGEGEEEVGDAARVRAGELMEELDRVIGKGSAGEDEDDRVREGGGGNDDNGDDGEALLGKAEELVRILEDEGLGDYLARAYRHAADLSARMGRLAEAQEWTAKERVILGFVSDG